MNNWSSATLYDVIEIIGGGTPKTAVQEYWNGDIPWLSVVDFNHGRKYVCRTEKCIIILGLENSITKLLKKDDIIISARGTVGVAAVLRSSMAFNQSCYGINPKKDLSNGDFIYYLLKDTVENFLLISPPQDCHREFCVAKCGDLPA